MSDQHQTTPAACCEADYLLGHALDSASKAIALAEVYETALREIARLGALVAHDLQGRVEGGKVAAVQRLADTAQEALAHGR
jgi:hypothetical protein